ncbi:MAG: hypothetical protein WCI42_01220 [Verrucomicrobiota bacterium]
MKTLILSLSTAFVFVCSVCAADAPAGSQAEATKLVAAIVTDDYKGFVANGNVAFQGLKKDQFEAVVSQLGPKLKAGYDLTYLGDRNQRGYQVTLWRIRFKSGGDDLLATLIMKDGKVGGFWIK